MSYFNETDKDKILDATSSSERMIDVIGDFIPNLRKKNNEFSGECPSCHGEYSFKINSAKGVFKCFKCNSVSGNNASSFLMKAQNMSFPEALEFLNHKFSIVSIVTTIPKTKKSLKPTTKKNPYCDRMLSESGLTRDDITATVFSTTKNTTTSTSVVFKSGLGYDREGNIIPGDDVIIEYFDLNGMPCMYEEKNSKREPTGKFKPFYRIRHQFPDEHKDGNGKPAKYKSPYGSGNFIYIPEKIRKLIRDKKTIDTLFLQEGEKKAEKACKHEIWSVGIAGIQNIARDKHLPQSLIDIIQKLGVKNIVLLFDGDWNDLSHNLKISEPVDGRPRNFYSAAKNYKDYMRTLINSRNIYLEIFIGYIKQNENHDKGIDDLLSNTLKSNPELLKEDIAYILNEKDLSGDYLKLFKITSCPESKIEEIWSLNNPTAFAKAHYDVLKDWPEFRIGRHIWKFDEKGEIESAQPLENDEKYWEEIKALDRYGNAKPVTYEFKYGRCFTFLQNRGFYRLMNLDKKTYQFIHINHPTVRAVEPFEIRDFVTEFTKVSANENVMEMIYKGGVQYLGPDKLSNIEFVRPVFEEPNREYQRFYFKNNCWEINKNEIKEFDYSSVTYNIWSEQRHDFPAVLRPELIHISDDEDGKYSYTITPEGEKCQFLQFLVNTSNFTWRKSKQISMGEREIVIDPEEKYEDTLHLISKLAAIGYMLLTAKDRSIPRMVIAMDGKQSEVGQSNGGSGKSIVGEMFKHVVSTAFIDGKKKNIEEDPFIWDSISESTKIVFIDDVRTNFSVEFLFPNSTNDWAVNRKGGSRFTIPFALSPKIYIPTNHALNGRGSSFARRQWIIAFSDFYNDEHSPKDDFGGLFFDDWDFIQWNLFWNLVANCIKIYLKLGVIQAPSERIETRQLRQDMGETFLSWSDEYFSDESKLNVQLIRKNLYDEYLRYSNLPPKLASPTSFKNKVKAFCTWKGYAFNPHMFDPISGKPLKYDKDGRPDIDDKSGGIEYFYIGNRPVTSSDAPIITNDNEVLPATGDLPY